VTAGPFRDGVETGCLIALAIFAVLFALGKCAQWSGVQ
jgi:hypothetical protein